MKTVLCAGAIVLCLLTGCEKDPFNRLPNATQKGKNTAGFLLEGEAWLPEGKFLTSTRNPVSGFWRKTPRGSSLGLSFLQVNSAKARFSGVDIYLVGIRQPGTYSLQQEPDINLGERRQGYASFFISQPAPSIQYYTGPTAPGTVTITRLDTINRIASGTFDLTLLEDGGTRTVRITKGRFDVRLAD
ncbi:hypothetical protein MUN82_20495 [Hymenobacter aerilatus]|uniref:Uncharacterized protein n=1 Tax=Hymenobacter aerilatus TaxID=2932251 RepID=A0A8T9SZU9_9BACT|nr:hypothetical protein [Hymenobacter aerilatus]UOR05299.1 hypothetical protein MUN82_20495 [Hymenobacter aerilatus]